MLLERKDRYTLFDEEKLVHHAILKLNPQIQFYCYNDEFPIIDYWKDPNYNNRVRVKLVELNNDKINDLEKSTAKFRISLIDRDNIINNFEEILELYDIRIEEIYDSKKVIDVVTKYLNNTHIESYLYDRFKTGVDKLPYDDYDKEVFFGLTCFETDRITIKLPDISSSEVIYIDKIESRAIRLSLVNSLPILQRHQLKEKVYSLNIEHPRVIADGISQKYIIDKDKLIIYNKGKKNEENKK